MPDSPVLKLEHADKRGEIYSIILPGDRELMLLHSNKGTLRGGHAHDVDEIVVILTGSMIYHKRDKRGIESKETVQAGDFSFNPAGLIHMGEFLEDTWLIEQKLAKKGEGRNLDYPDWREKVKASTV